MGLDEAAGESEAQAELELGKFFFTKGQDTNVLLFAAQPC